MDRIARYSQGPSFFRAADSIPIRQRFSWRFSDWHKDRFHGFRPVLS